MAVAREGEPLRADFQARYEYPSTLPETVDEQDGKVQALEQELILLREQQPAPPPPAENRVQQAMADLDRLADLAAPEAGNISVRELAEAMDLRVWLRFRQIRQGKK